MKNKSSDTSLISLLAEIKTISPLKLEVGELYKIYHNDKKKSYNILMFKGFDESGDYVLQVFDWRGEKPTSESSPVSKDIIDNKHNKKLIEKF